MSVLVKGMEMPESCYKCQFLIYNSETEDCYCACNAGVRGMADNKAKWSHVNENCPLVEVPTPHGRLIDADAFLATIRQICDDDSRAVCTVETIKRLVIKHIKDAPTIIDAEENSK